MLTSILGARLRWHFANGWVFEPVIVGPDVIDYTLKEGPHAGRHAIQHFYYQRVAFGVETTVWYGGKWSACPYYLVSGDANGSPLRRTSCLAGRRYDRLSGGQPGPRVPRENQNAYFTAAGLAPAHPQR
jgi:hypothetical protein